MEVAPERLFLVRGGNRGRDIVMEAAKSANENATLKSRAALNVIE